MRMRKATLLVALAQLMPGPVLVYQVVPGLAELEAATLKPSTGLPAGETGQVLAARNDARLALRRWCSRGSSHHMRNNGLITSRPAVAVWNTFRLQATGSKNMERTSL